MIWVSPVFSYVRQLAGDLELPDIIDILVLAVLLYVGLTWVLWTRSRAIVVMVAVFVLLSFLAHHYDLYLTTLLLKEISTAVLVVMAVIFQSDLRRSYARIEAWWRGYRRRGAAPRDPSIDTLVQVAFAAAARNIGALFVIAGRDPIGHLLHGGIAVSAPVDRGLLLSVFDPSTPGHDGAAVIDGGRITHLGAHLPLSTTTVVPGVGTRHAAALGLCEASDALVLVVSEERGDVSLAVDGRLTVMNSGAELRERLDACLRERFRTKEHPPLGRRIAKGVLVASASLLLAVTSWVVLTVHPGEVVRTFLVPIEYIDTPPGLHLVSPAASNAHVLLIGSERAFDLLGLEELRVAVPLRNVHAGENVVRLSDSNVIHPAELRVYALQPRLLRLEFEADRTESTARPAATAARPTTTTR